VLHIFVQVHNTPSKDVQRLSDRVQAHLMIVDELGAIHRLSINRENRER
jgi:hypothetical protein